MSQGRLRQEYPSPSEAFDYRVEVQGDRVRVNLGGNEVELAVTALDAGSGRCDTGDGSTHVFHWARNGSSLHIWLGGGLFIFERVESSRRANRDASGGGGSDILAPMPGTVERILAQPGDTVERGQTVVIMESMKMELEIAAHRAGVVKRVAVEQGDQVDKGMRLLELDELEETS